MSVIKAEWVARDRAVARLPNGGSVVYDYRGTTDAPQARAAAEPAPWKKTPTGWTLRCAEGSLAIALRDETVPVPYQAQDAATLSDAIAREPRGEGPAMLSIVTEPDTWTRTGERSWSVLVRGARLTATLGEQPKARGSVRDSVARAVVDSAGVLAGAIRGKPRAAAGRGPGLESLVAPKKGWRK